jgi:hypothetical protein
MAKLSSFDSGYCGYHGNAILYDFLRMTQLVVNLTAANLVRACSRRVGNQFSHNV